MLFSWPYPEAPIEGYWGKPTSLIDWCEENYVVSPYIQNGQILLLIVYS